MIPLSKHIFEYMKAVLKTHGLDSEIWLTQSFFLHVKFNTEYFYIEIIKLQFFDIFSYFSVYNMYEYQII